MDAPHLSYSPAVQQALDEINKTSVASSATNINQPQQLKHSPTIEEALNNIEGVNSNPDDVAFAKNKIGNQGYIDLCQKFVEEATGSKTKYATAADAWTGQSNIARPGLDGAKPGDTVYFAPDESNYNDGHAGVYVGKGKFISATSNGVQEYSLDQWQKDTGQQLLGYIPQ